MMVQTVLMAAEKYELMFESTEVALAPGKTPTPTPAVPCLPCTAPTDRTAPHRTVPCRAVPCRAPPSSPFVACAGPESNRGSHVLKRSEIPLDHACVATPDAP